MQSNEFSKQEIDSGKGMAILSYIGVLALIPYFTEKKNKYVRFHVVQGINLLIYGVILGIAQSIITGITTATALTSYGYAAVTSSIAATGVVSTIFGVIWIVFVVLEIIGIVNAASGKATPVPILGKLLIVKK